MHRHREQQWRGAVNALDEQRSQAGAVPELALMFDLIDVV
ncbi:hypothetical protein VVMO6_02857 [Vibrio vulnificus MO6-24/O]|nr:hypothetical protein VVMO6_02857 [Vibrio vulnificus MO6-24/O]